MTGTPGNSDSWEREWSKLSASDGVLFTRGRPKTLLEFWQRAYADDLLRCFGSRSAGVPGRSVELGSGRGTTSMYLAEAGFETTLVDLSPTALALARRNFVCEGLSEPVTVPADAQDCGLPSGSYEVVLNIGVLEHFEDPQPLLREACRLLAPGGLLFMVIVPAQRQRGRWPADAILCPWHVPRLLGDWLAARGGDYAQVADEEMVRTEHTREKYLAWMKELGETEASCLPYNPYHPLPCSRSWEERVVVPAYEAHRRYFGRKGLIATSPSLALCDLLLLNRQQRSDRSA